MPNKLVILTGPQGSGNHLFSKIFSYHPDVHGWDFGEKYWIPSDEEPFAECWVNPEKTSEMLTESLMVANVSVPFVYDGVKQVPKLQEVIYEAQDAGYQVTVCVVVREQNINMEQQKRVRKEITLPTALEYYQNLEPRWARGYQWNLEFVSHESLYLYKGMYLKWLSSKIGFPIAYDDVRVERDLSDNQNAKYVNHVQQHWLDHQVWNGLRPKSER